MGRLRGVAGLRLWRRIRSHGGCDQLVELLAGDGCRKGLIGPACDRHLVAVKKDDLDPSFALLRLLLGRGLGGRLFDLGPEQSIGVDEASDLAVAGLAGLAAFGLQLGRLHADGRERWCLGPGQLDLSQLGIQLFGGARQGQLIHGKNHDFCQPDGGRRLRRRHRHRSVDHRGGSRLAVGAAESTSKDHGCQHEAVLG